ncbi:alcohol dehydrogenase, partial [Exophiala aquamarina CBS 119918]
MVEKCERCFGVKATAIKGDIGIVADCIRLVNETIKTLGGLDIIVNNAGWTKFTDFNDLEALTHEEWLKCWQVNVMSHLVLMQQASPIFNTNDDGGVLLVTSSVAGIALGGSSMGYAVTKAAGLQLVRCLAYTQGPKIRVNAILPGLLLTEWGLKFSEEQLQMSKDQAVLKQETNLEDCADAFLFAARNSSMTGREIIVGMFCQ